MRFPATQVLVAQTSVCAPFRSGKVKPTQACPSGRRAEACATRPRRPVFVGTHWNGSASKTKFLCEMTTRLLSKKCATLSFVCPALLDASNFIHTALVAPPSEWGGKPYSEDFARGFRRNQLRPERQHVGIVMFAAVARRRAIIAQRRARSGDLVGGNRAADPGAVDHATEPGVSPRDGVRHRLGKVGVIDSRGAVSAQI